MKRLTLMAALFLRKNYRLIMLLKKYPKIFGLRYIGGLSDARIIRLFSNIDKEYLLWIEIGERYVQESEKECELLDLAPGFLVARSDGNLQMKTDSDKYANILDDFKEVNNLIRQRNKEYLPYFMCFATLFAVLSLVIPYLALVPSVAALVFLIFIIW